MAPLSIGRSRLASRRSRRVLALPEMLEARRLLALSPLRITSIDVPGTAAASNMWLLVNDSEQIHIRYSEGAEMREVIRTRGSFGTTHTTDLIVVGINDLMQQSSFKFTKYLDSYQAKSFFTHSQEGIFVELKYPGGTFDNLAAGINDAGDVVGYYSSLDYGPSGAFLWSGGTYTQLIEHGEIVGINDSGQYLSHIYDVWSSTGLIWGAGNSVPIGVPGAAFTTPTAFNDSGEVVGIFFMPGGGPSQGFLFSEGEYATIEIDGATEVRATGINDAGDVVGSYRDAAGIVHGFLASRRDPIQIDINQSDLINLSDRDSDDVAIMVPADSDLKRPAYAQRLKVDVKNNTLETFEVELEILAAPSGESGSVEFEQSELSDRPLGPGETRTIWLTPKRRSTVADDVLIIAREKGGEKRELGRDFMTVVEVIPPKKVSAANTPKEMPDRIPPRVDTPIKVKLMPSLVSAGQSIKLNFDVDRQGPRGTVTIGGAGGVVTQTFQETTYLALRGESQTPMDGEGVLRLVTTLLTGNEIGSSATFRVTAIPIGMTFEYVDSFTGETIGEILAGLNAESEEDKGLHFFGVVIRGLIESDSKDGRDLIGSIIQEEVYDGSDSPRRLQVKTEQSTGPYLIIYDLHGDTYTSQRLQAHKNLLIEAGRLLTDPLQRVRIKDSNVQQGHSFKIPGASDDFFPIASSGYKRLRDVLIGGIFKDGVLVEVVEAIYISKSGHLVQAPDATFEIGGGSYKTNPPLLILHPIAQPARPPQDVPDAPDPGPTTRPPVTPDPPQVKAQGMTIETDALGRRSLVIVGSEGGGDTFTIRQDRRRITVSEGGRRSRSFSNVDVIYVHGQGGADDLRVRNVSIPVIADMGAGDDRIVAFGSRVVADGGLGNDVFTFGAGGVYVGIGGEGGDRIRQSSRKALSITGTVNLANMNLLGVLADLSAGKSARLRQTLTGMVAQDAARDYVLSSGGLGIWDDMDAVPYRRRVRRLLQL